MDTSALQIFVEVVRRGSFAVVARERNIDPSAVSRTIRGLERELSVRLFQRTTRRLAPTEAGLVYFERIEPLVDEMERARLVVGDVGAKPRGTLRVTTSVSFGQRCLAPLLPELAGAYPDLALDLMLTDAVIDIVAERIDVALRLGRPTDSALIASLLMPTHYAVCASPLYVRGHGALRTPEDLAAHECLLLPLAGFRSRWHFRGKDGSRSTVPVKGRILISNTVALQQCALAGMGPALLPHWLTEAEIARGDLIDLFPDHAVTATDFDTGVWLLYPSRVYVPLKVRAFTEFLKRAFREHPPWRR